jgi:hypothetical protein
MFESEHLVYDIGQLTGNYPEAIQKLSRSDSGSKNGH